MKTSAQIRIFALGIFLLVALISSCAQTQDRQIPTSTVMLPSAFPSQSSTPNASLTQTPTLTPTINSSDATFSAQFITSKARTVATRTAAFATLTSRNAVCDDGYGFGFFAEDVLRGLDYYSTNDGERWTVIKCVPEKLPQLKGYTKIINSDSSKIWSISYESLPLPGNYEFISGYTIDSIHNFLYVVPSNFSGRDGWCPSCLFGYGSPLYRLDLSSGKITSILPYIDDGYYVDISISPDVRHLVYSDSRDGNNVHLKDLISGSDTKIELENIYVINGGFTWTLDGKSLIFAAGANGWKDGAAGISLFQLNLSTMKFQTLLLNDRRNLVPWFNSDSSKIWLDDSTLNLASIKVSERDFSSNEWSINIKTGEVIRLSKPTPTPTP